MSKIFDTKKDAEVFANLKRKKGYNKIIISRLNIRGKIKYEVFAIKVYSIDEFLDLFDRKDIKKLKRRK